MLWLKVSHAPWYLFRQELVGVRVDAVHVEVLDLVNVHLYFDLVHAGFFQDRDLQNRLRSDISQIIQQVVVILPFGEL